MNIRKRDDVMNEQELENLRAEYLIKFFKYLISAVLLTAVTLYIVWIIISLNNDTLEVLFKIIFAAALFSSFFLYSAACSAVKQYENNVKSHLIKIALRNIPDLNINWETEKSGYQYSTAVDFGIEEQQKWYKKFDNERKTFRNELLNLRNYYSKIALNKYQKIKGRKKEDFNEEEKQIYNEASAKLNELFEKEKILRTEQYKKDCIELKKINTAYLNSNKKSKKDYYKIKYLKNKIKEYKELINIGKNFSELQDLKAKSMTGSLTEAEKERMEQIESSSSNETTQNTEDKLNRLMFVCSVFNTFLSTDDNFFGSYKGKEFLFTEVHDNLSKHPVFNGTLLKIVLNNEFNNKILVLKKKFISSDYWENTVKKGLNKLRMKLPFYADYEIYAKSPNYINEIINSDFINFVNTLRNYSYIIEGKNLYVMIPHKRDRYKFGSLFKRINDKNQYQTFYKDINEILRIIESAARYSL